MPKALNDTVRRYTSLSVALDMLINKQIVLVDPAKWDDGNDTHFIDLYKHKASIGSVLACCMTASTETYHHWKLYAPGLDGVCIEFNREKLQSYVSKAPGVEFKPVDYLLIKDLKKMTTSDAHRLPFIKRDAYGDEREWRMIVTSRAKDVQAHCVPLGLDAIRRIRLSPWTSFGLRKTVRELVRQQPDCGRMSVISSGLTNSPKWRSAGAAIAGI